MRRPNIYVIKISIDNRYQGNIFKNDEWYFSIIFEDITLQIQKDQGNLGGINKKKYTLRHIIGKEQNTKDTQNILKASKGKR